MAILADAWLCYQVVCNLYISFVSLCATQFSLKWRAVGVSCFINSSSVSYSLLFAAFAELGQ